MNFTVPSSIPDPQCIVGTEPVDVVFVFARAHAVDFFAAYAVERDTCVRIWRSRHFNIVSGQKRTFTNLPTADANSNAEHVYRETISTP